MSDWVIYGLYSLGAVGILVSGLLMFLVPAEFIKLTDRIGGANKWSRPNPEWKPGSYVQWRLAGLGLAAMAILMLKPLILAVFGSSPVIGHTRSGGTQAASSPDWLALGIGVVMILGGAYTLIRPELLLQWGRTRLPHRVFAEDAVRKGRPGVRIMGGVAVVAGAFAIYAWLKYYIR